MTLRAVAIGRMAEPKQIETRSGVPLTKARVAINTKPDDPKATWVTLVAFKDLAADLASRGKGQTVAAEGRLSQDSWTDKQGQERFDLELIVERFLPDLSRSAHRPGKQEFDAQRGLYGDSAPPMAKSADDFDEGLSFMGGPQ